MSGGDGELIAAFLLADEVESDICVFTGGADVVAVGADDLEDGSVQQFSTLPDVPLKSQLFQSMNVPAGVGIDTGSPEAAVAESPPIAIMADRVRAELNFLNMNDG